MTNTKSVVCEARSIFGKSEEAQAAERPQRGYSRELLGIDGAPRRREGGAYLEPGPAQKKGVLHAD